MQHTSQITGIGCGGLGERRLLLGSQALLLSLASNPPSLSFLAFEVLEIAIMVTTKVAYLESCKTSR